MIYSNCQVLTTKFKFSVLGFKDKNPVFVYKKILTKSAYYAMIKKIQLSIKEEFLMKKVMFSILLAGAFVLPCSNQLLLHAEDSVLAEENVIVVNNLKLQDDEYTYSIIGVEDTTVTSVTIPTEYNGKIIFADGECFNDCPNLTEILVEEDNELYRRQKH